MEILELSYKIFGITVTFFLAVSSFYGIYAIYYAYIKTKDEREKFIVLRSTAKAFGVVLIYFLLDGIVLSLRVDWLLLAWDIVRFKSGLTVSVLFGMMAVLGVCLFLNKRKMGEVSEK